jgi:hypothetical protein
MACGQGKIGVRVYRQRRTFEIVKAAPRRRDCQAGARVSRVGVFFNNADHVVHTTILHIQTNYK